MYKMPTRVILPKDMKLLFKKHISNIAPASDMRQYSCKLEYDENEAVRTANLAGWQMHKDVQNFNTLFYSCDSLKRRHYQILHHHLKVLDAVAEPGINEDNSLC